MRTLFDGVLCEREFGAASVTTEQLIGWAKTKGIRLPATYPSLNGYDAAQLEALLCAIEWAAKGDAPGDGMPVISDEAAMVMATSISTDDKRKRERAAENPGYARWLLGANAHLQWRKLLEAALAAGELNTFDFHTGLPLVLNTHGSKLPVQQDEAPPIARSGNDSRWTLQECENLLKKHKELKASGVKDPTQRLASELGLSAARVRQLMAKVKPQPLAGKAAGPFDQLGGARR